MLENFKKYNFDFIYYSKYSIIISLSTLLIGGTLFLIRGLKSSIDFTGGTVVNLSITEKNVNISELREYLKNYLEKDVVVVETESTLDTYNILLTMKFLDDEKILNQSLLNLYGDKYHINQIESIGPKIGDELRKSARNAIIIAMFLIGTYIAFRFDSFYAFGSLIALAHDISITLSFLILFKLEISISIIAALLTIVGYSLNDTIVIYDRIREHLKLNLKEDKKTLINQALNITLNRTIITSFTTLIVVLVLFFIGGEVLKPFSIALIIGIITGTYSSLFIATPMMLILDEKYKLEELEEK